ncbi:lactate dehydrogenase [Weizmannia acidilactici]|uniref:Lactate dehydrogenase n=1 Tax=Weizmannia acidilactici TaxID=2607726 RepID=A0A5J4J8U1_9BACI|nr:D-isomer specific 2-hydroxyacid dehydrogenase family protein [Weizmannia acidilactici]GER67430.1 lactate dehydrogenase [Weizmannia acidilactici]GER71292.1 lactate dehydrogenase [Weizmannia acidilactici]GER72572.1 lactate dehydrogenase [Weizmannia acidilactici]
MKKVVVYEPRPDEMPLFQKFADELGLDIKYVDGVLTPETAAEAKGAEGVTILGNYPVGQDTFKALSEAGVKYIGLRTAGYNNIDREAAKAYGIRFSNVTYSPYCVADFATMLILMCIRKAKQIFYRTNAQDFSLEGIQGREMRNLTVGIIGAGRIGSIVAKNLSGFGCRVIAYDIVERDELRGLLEYVTFDELLAESDVITLHTPLFESTYHMINRKTIAKMKDGACLINCARGAVVDTEALIAGIESGKIGAAGIDVLEGEEDIFHYDRRTDILGHRQLAVLRSFPNVIVTPHTAFYTDQAVSDMVELALRSLVSFIETGESSFEIKN